MQDQHHNQPTSHGDSSHNHNFLNSSKDGRAITSLVLSVSSLMVPFGGFILAIIGLIFGINALKEDPNNGMARAGKIISIFSLCFSVLFGIVLMLLLLIPGLFAGITGIISYYLLSP